MRTESFGALGGRFAGIAIAVVLVLAPATTSAQIVRTRVNVGHVTFTVDPFGVPRVVRQPAAGEKLPLFPGSLFLVASDPQPCVGACTFAGTAATLVAHPLGAWGVFVAPNSYLLQSAGVQDDAELRFDFDVDFDLGAVGLPLPPLQIQHPSASYRVYGKVREGGRAEFHAHMILTSARNGQIGTLDLDFETPPGFTGPFDQVLVDPGFDMALGPFDRLNVVGTLIWEAQAADVQGAPVGVAGVGGADREKCLGKKLKCIAKKQAGLLACHAKAHAAGAAADAACLAKVAAVYDACMPKAEKAGGCNVGDAAALEVTVDQFVADVGLILDPNFPAPRLSKCLSAKDKCTAKKAFALLMCHAKAAKKGGPPDGKCIRKAEDRFSFPAKGCMEKAEIKGDCVAVGDAAAVEARVNAFVEDAITGLTARCGDGVIAPNVEGCDPPDKQVGCLANEVCNTNCQCEDLATLCADPTPVAVGSHVGATPDGDVYAGWQVSPLTTCSEPGPQRGMVCALPTDCDSAPMAGDGQCSGTYGTLGAFPFRNASPDESMLLSNNHVMARTSGSTPPPDGNATVGEPLYQPLPAPWIAQLDDYEDLCFDGDAACAATLNALGNNCIDAALATPLSGLTLAEIFDVGAPTGYPGLPLPDPLPAPPANCNSAVTGADVLGTIVRKSGARTGLTCGKVTAVGMTAIGYRGGNKVATFANQLHISALPVCAPGNLNAGSPCLAVGNGNGCDDVAVGDDGGTCVPHHFSCGGDSGSLVVGAASNDPIGLGYAGFSPSDCQRHCRGTTDPCDINLDCLNADPCTASRCSRTLLGCASSDDCDAGFCSVMGNPCHVDADCAAGEQCTGVCLGNPAVPCLSHAHCMGGIGPCVNLPEICRAEVSYANPIDLVLDRFDVSF